MLIYFLQLNCQQFWQEQYSFMTSIVS